MGESEVVLGFARSYRAELERGDISGRLLRPCRVCSEAGAQSFSCVVRHVQDPGSEEATHNAGVGFHPQQALALKRNLWCQQLPRPAEDAARKVVAEPVIPVIVEVDRGRGRLGGTDVDGHAERRGPVECRGDIGVVEEPAADRAVAHAADEAVLSNAVVEFVRGRRRLGERKRGGSAEPLGMRPPAKRRASPAGLQASPMRNVSGCRRCLSLK